MIISRSIHVAANSIISFFFMANIPLYILFIFIYNIYILFIFIYIFYIYIYIHTYIYIYIYIYIHHIFFIHSSVDGHFGCFHVLAIVNSVTMLRYVPSVTPLVTVLSWMDVKFVKCFFSVYWDDHVVFVFPFVHVVYHTDWCAYVKPFLWPWNEFHLIKVYDPFYILLDSVS